MDRITISRRQFLVTASMLALAGCTSQSSSPEAKPASGPKYGGVLNFCQTNDAPHLDPHTETMYARWVTALVYSNLVKFEPQEDPNAFKVVPNLAESWEQVDDRTLVFKLHQGAKFHNLPPVNGREVTSDDVKYSLDRIRTEKPEFQRRTQLADIEKIEMPDKYTVKITTKAPSAPFLSYLAEDWNVVVPKEVVERDGDLRKTAIGTGPFVLKEWNKGIGFTLDKNPDYYIKGRPYLDGVSIKVVPDQSTQVAALRSRQIEVMFGVPPAEVEGIKKTNPDIVWQKFGQDSFQYGRLNIAQAPFNDIKVRQAFALAIDQDEIIKTVLQGDAKPSGVFPWTMGEWAIPPTDLPFHKQDIAKAKQLLAEAGYPNGLKVKGLTDATKGYGQDMSIAVSQQLKQIGVEDEIDLKEYGAYLQAAVNKQFQLNVHWGLGYTDPDGYCQEFSTTSSRNFGGWGNAELDALIAKQRATINREERKKIVFEIQRKVADQVYKISLPNWHYYSARQSYVKGYLPVVRGTYERAFENTWLDK